MVYMDNFIIIYTDNHIINYRNYLPGRFYKLILWLNSSYEEVFGKYCKEKEKC